MLIEMGDVLVVEGYVVGESMLVDIDIVGSSRQFV
jgi:hypothetical protein